MNIVKSNGFLSIRNSKLTNQHGNEIVLNGVSLGWHNWTVEWWNEKVVHWLNKDWCADIIRAPLGIEANDNSPTFTKAPAFSMKILDSVIQGAIQSGVYVIIDWHDHEAPKRIDNKHDFHLAKSFFSEISKRHGHLPNILYEIFNEPLDVPWHEVKTYAEEIIPCIRKHDKNNIIIVGCPNWCQDIDKAANNPIKNHTNIMYSLHFYSGSHGTLLRERADQALEQKLPIFVSEYGGTQADGRDPIDYEEWDKWILWMQNHNLSSCHYAVRGGCGQGCDSLQKWASGNGNWKEEDLSPHGLQARTILRKLRGKKEIA